MKPSGGHESSFAGREHYSRLVAEEDAAVVELAEELLGQTGEALTMDTPCDPEPGIDPERLGRCRRLQDLLLVPGRCADVALRNGVELAVTARAPRAETPTGDFFDVVETPDGRLSLMVGDAVGHDNPTAWANSLRFNLFVRSEHFDLDAAYPAGAPASQALCFIDAHCNFRGNAIIDDAVVVSHSLLDPRTGKLIFADASNNHLFVLRRDGCVEEFEAAGARISNPLPVQYLCSEPGNARTFLERGDVGIMMSDGVPDGVHRSGVLMAAALPEVLARLARERLSPQEVVTRILAEMAATEDDLVLMAFGLATGG